MIEAALRESGGRVSGPSGAAIKLGIPGSTLDSKIRSLKIDKNRFKSTYPFQQIATDQSSALSLQESRIDPRPPNFRESRKFSGTSKLLEFR
jgi:hypothetical protein